MSKVSWYKQRLKALLFKARFADKVEEIKPVRILVLVLYTPPSILPYYIERAALCTFPLDFYSVENLIEWKVEN